MKKGDFVLIVFLLFIFTCGFFYTNSRYFHSDDKYISVRVNGKEIKQITFGNEKKIYPIRTSFGLNILEVDKDSVRVIEASCPKNSKSWSVNYLYAKQTCYSDKIKK